MTTTPLVYRLPVLFRLRHQHRCIALDLFAGAGCFSRPLVGISGWPQTSGFWDESGDLTLLSIHLAAGGGRQNRGELTDCDCSSGSLFLDGGRRFRTVGRSEPGRLALRQISLNGDL